MTEERQLQKVSRDLHKNQFIPEEAGEKDNSILYGYKWPTR
jgi:hypothetical protein